MREPDRRGGRPSRCLPRRPAARASGAVGSARRSVSIVGSAATAASSSAARVAGGSAAIRASTRPPSVSGIGRRPSRTSEVHGRVGERAGDLERVERVAGRRLLDPDEHEARERSAEPGQEQLVQRGQRQRPELQAIPSVWRDAGEQLASSGRRRSRGPRGADRSAGRRAAGWRTRGSRRRRRRATGHRRSRGSAGPPLASWRRRVAVATESVRWSGSCPVGSARRIAISRAWRCTVGRGASSSEETSARRSVSPPRRQGPLRLRRRRRGGRGHRPRRLAGRLRPRCWSCRYRPRRR